MVYMYIQSSFMFLRFAICEIRKKATKDTGGRAQANSFYKYDTEPSAFFF